MASRFAPPPAQPSYVPPSYATLQESAERYRCSVKTIRRMISRGDLVGYKFGPRAIRVDLAELEAVLRPIPNAKSA